MKKPRFFTIPDAARELGLTHQALRKAIKRDLLDTQPKTIIKMVERKITIEVVTAAALEKYRKEHPVSLSHQERGKKT